MSNLQLAGTSIPLSRADIPAVLASSIPSNGGKLSNPYQMDGAADRAAGVLEMFMPIGSDWDGFAVNVGTLHDAGDHVVMEAATRAVKPSGEH
jgi:hypothetical protein